MIDSSTELLVRNTTCGLFMLDGELSEWVKNNPFNRNGNELEFILQVESNNNSDVYITLDYSVEGYTNAINAVYIGKKLTEKEKVYVSNFQPVTLSSFSKKGIKTPILESMKFLKISDSLKITIADSLHNLVERMLMSNTVDGTKVGFTKTSVVVYMRYTNGKVIKVEYYLNDIEKFMAELLEHTLSTSRQVFRKFIKGETKCNV